MENLDLTERNRVLQEGLKDCQDELRESNRERVFLEGELKYFRSHPSQLRASSTTSSLLKKPSTITLRAHYESSKHIEGLPSSQSLPTSLNSPLAVRRLAPVTPLTIKLKQRSSVRSASLPFSSSQNQPRSLSRHTS
ncbi:hypothetical protein BDY24DRAFT_390533 [Mrakia frigida]|uniref:uncharacterized protein n=1 Tax=Mrakia frigida TaxID=29902 RepID=UPI003FCBFE92